MSSIAKTDGSFYKKNLRHESKVEERVMYFQNTLKRQAYMFVMFEFKRHMWSTC